VVAAFLAALRNGDEATATQLLTNKARAETARHDLVVQPPGAPSASYQVGQVDYVTKDKDGAHVQSAWTEADDDGVTHTYEIIWVLRRQSDGWRVAGMVPSLDEGEACLYLNFEDPEDMLYKWKQADPTLTAESEEPIHQARRRDNEAAPASR
jgi:hypothetical protein